MTGTRKGALVEAPIRMIEDLDKNFVPKSPKSPFRDTDAAAVRFRQALAKLDEVIATLGDQFVIQMQDTDGIAEARLDFSPTSLDAIDAHMAAIDYPNFFKRDYVADWFVPTLGGYLARTLFKNLKVFWKYRAKAYRHAVLATGSREFYPFALANDAVYSGYRLRHFYDVVAYYASR